MSHKYLKIKIKSLAAEATMIRQEENKEKAAYRRLKGIQGREKAYDEHVSTFWGLRHHRTCDVRDESRAAQLAYAYVRGKPFKFVENNTIVCGWWDNHSNQPIGLNAELDGLLIRVTRLANKYGKHSVTEDDILDWYKFGITKETITDQRIRAKAREDKVVNRRKARAAKAKETQAA